ncbi:hypothetical protein AVEN_167298-1 [Araneus ventricosus]|uniref:Uncharacterized protein n=1 Tax=Araneus ventricosus TaxID=182803 RepID=A0A4Y2DC00_ARAVE|nr:hypothetical protein AVEN_167298-1 [Araneus ventricosus]
MPILRDTGTTVDIVSRNRIRPEMLTGEQIWVQQTFDEKPICWSLAEVELKGKFDQLKTKAAVVCNEADKGKYLLGNRTAALLGKDRERLLFPKFMSYRLEPRSEWLSRIGKQASCEIPFPKESVLKK